MTENPVSRGYVYLFENEFNYVKVGYSNNPDHRAKTIESASGVTIIKSYVSPICTNFVHIERELKHQFAPYRKKGEWFDIKFSTAQAALDSYFPQKVKTPDIEPVIDVSNHTIGNNQEELTVNARELHAFLEVKTRFNDWINTRVKEYEFVQGVDFIVTENLVASETKTYGQGKIDYLITLDMAKELSMVEKTARGKEARQYFIACEKALKQGKSLPTVNEDDVRMHHHICEITKIALGINEKQRSGDLVYCQYCGKPFQKKNYRHIYCCEECRIRAHGYTTKGELIARKKLSHG
jgi:phage anti-repressor protein/ribosomal protein L37AE/L43A